MSQNRPRAPVARAPLDALDPPVRGLILDVDGVLWKDAQQIGDLASAFAAIAARQLGVSIATNNAMNRVEDYLLKLRGFGVQIDAWQVVTSAEATADTLAQTLPDRGGVFVVGERGLIEALQSRGFEVVTDPSADRRYAAVVAGLDRDLTYAKLRKASTLVRSGLPFYGTNPDETFPTPSGLIPGAGAVLAGISAAAGVPPTVVGKPSSLLFEIAARRMKLLPEELLIVGDRLETDIQGGQAFGTRCALVLSGVSTREQAAAWKPAPTIIAASLSELLGA
ncbi:MAG TPA: HAD-IIA family hydrolase [Anaerolineales bacterium]|nr:HAD-IIA family hydrolase [Anaerolineales bacterium]